MDRGKAMRKLLVSAVAVIVLSGAAHAEHYYNHIRANPHITQSYGFHGKCNGGIHKQAIKKGKWVETDRQPLSCERSIVSQYDSGRISYKFIDDHPENILGLGGLEDKTNIAKINVDHLNPPLHSKFKAIGHDQLVVQGPLQFGACELGRLQK